MDKSREIIEWLASREPEIPAGQLQLGQMIGNGSLGQVFLGVFRGQHVAVKKMHCDDTNPERMVKILDTFRREVTILRALTHSNIVRYIGAYAEGASVCVVTEYLSGGSLHDVLHTRREPMTYPRALHIASDISAGMLYLHSCRPQVLHRDLSPSNVLLNAHGRAKIADFGLSRLNESVGGDILTRTGQWRYVAPEITRAQSTTVFYTDRVDVYSFGVMLWEIFSRKIPFLGMDDMKAATEAVCCCCFYVSCDFFFSGISQQEASAAS
eukprot:TRINITY_DN1650_c0_g1_i3.p1 TRINITY_DN1650_c0_g1~~TRINITY_DN1650_c0_g1_i3.p1  ORF type:complete len:306 (+),score=68.08 TRINITY_DN1650_c0_g1_i3:117-920(+)